MRDDKADPSADSEAMKANAQQRVRELRLRCPTLTEDAIDVILREARSHYAWQAKSVPEAILRELYAMTAAGATSMNSCPAKFVFVNTQAGKARLLKALKPTNVAKMEGAPVTVIVAYDIAFWQDLLYLFPHEDRRHFFEGKHEYTEETAFRNSTLQGGYMMIAARALGLDVGAMSGFSNEIVDEEFFPTSTLRSNFLINIGYADESALFQKLPRLDFERACSFA